MTVRVPATSANMGPGFDTLGMALDIWNEMIVERASSFQMIIEGEGAGQLPCDHTNLCCVGLKAAFDAAGKKVPPLKYTCKNKIPFARGLGALLRQFCGSKNKREFVIFAVCRLFSFFSGSSSAAIVGGIIAGLVLAGHRMRVWGQEELLQVYTIHLQKLTSVTFT